MRDTPLEPRWEVIEPLLDRALGLAPDEQEVLLRRMGSDDPALEAAVRRLLEADHRAGAFLEQPAALYAGPLLAWVASHDPLEPGAALGGYQIVRRLGRGATATVYLAHDPKHRRSVAVKVLHPDLAAAVGAERFLREIEIAATLQHPHILPLFDSGAVDGLLYYVMPHVEGESLRQRLAAEGPLPVEQALRIAREVAEALDYSHRHGVVHRDVKPENILLQDGQAIVADFGIARAICAADGGPEARGSGTPAYMSPEQADRTAALDGRSDVYALGCVLFEMLCGEPPFTGDSARQVLKHHAQSPVPALVRPGRSIPPAVDRAVQRALAKMPSERFATAAEFAAGLGPAATDPSRRRWAAAAVLAAGVAVAGIVAQAGHDRGPPTSAPALGHRSRLTLDPGLETDPALSPDGRRVAYAAGTSSELALYIRAIGGGAPTPVASSVPRPQRFPSWSPDGRRILFASPRGIELAVVGDSSRVLIPTPDTAEGDKPRPGGSTALSPGTWAPDGRRFVFVRGDSLYVTDVDPREVRLLAHGGQPHSAAWSPDGRRIAYVTGNRDALETGYLFGNAGRSAIWIVPANGGASKRLSTGGTSDMHPVWLPGSRGLLFISDRDGGADLWQAGVEGSAPPVRLSTGLDPATLSLSADGTRLVYSVFSESANIWTLPIPAGSSVSISTARAVTTGSQVIEGLDVSPDGRWLAFDSDRHGVPEVYRMRLGGEAVEQLTKGPDAEFGPLWSPDGRELAFHGFRDGRRQIFVMSASGTDLVQVTRDGNDNRSPEWLAGGSAMLYRTLANGRPEVRVIVRDTAGRWGEPRTLLEGEVIHASVSPNGLWVAFTSAAGLRAGPYTGALPVVVAPDALSGGRRPVRVAWSDDGRTLYLLALDPAGHASVWSVSRDGGRPTQRVVFDDPAKVWHRFGFRSRRGQFYFTLGDRQSDLWEMEVGGK